jgi:voltage-gated potassium channel
VTLKGRLRTLVSSILLVVAYFVVPVDLHGGTAATIVRIIVTAAGIAGATWIILRQVSRQLDRDDTPLLGLLLAIVASVLIFALADFVIATTQPGQFVDLNTRIDGLYFALTTLSTIGFGDVHAEGQFARGLLCVQIIFNVAIVATAASLLGRQISQRAREKRSGTNRPE